MSLHSFRGFKDERAKRFYVLVRHLEQAQYDVWHALTLMLCEELRAGRVVVHGTSIDVYAPTHLKDPMVHSYSLRHDGLDSIERIQEAAQCEYLFDKWSRADRGRICIDIFLPINLPWLRIA